MTNPGLRDAILTPEERKRLQSADLSNLRDKDIAFVVCAIERLNGAIEAALAQAEPPPLMPDWDSLRRTGYRIFQMAKAQGETEQRAVERVVEAIGNGELRVWGLMEQAHRNTAPLRERLKESERPLDRDFVLDAQAEPPPRDAIAVLREMVAAMRDYEMEVDEPAPYKHRAMMERADAMLAAAERDLTLKRVRSGAKASPSCSCGCGERVPLHGARLRGHVPAAERGPSETPRTEAVELRVVGKERSVESSRHPERVSGPTTASAVDSAKSATDLPYLSPAPLPVSSDELCEFFERLFLLEAHTPRATAGFKNIADQLLLNFVQTVVDKLAVNARPSGTGPTEPQA